ncbi:MAG TPA: N-acetyl-gamma-glutamyl-phosphate reductase [Dialister sp.]|nr:N-acetyl-gamma-glutamyl-phosphate reductase [Dialister sp.]
MTTAKALPKVFIVGESGTTGLRLHDRLIKRNDIELLSLPEEKKKDIPTIVEFAKKADLMFLCLPDAASKEIVAATEGTGIRILDTSTAHRTKEDWVYGFPELSKTQEEAIKNAQKVAVPGCHASGVISILYPLVQAGILPINYPLHCISLTGYSGGGKNMIHQYEQEKDTPLESPRQYGLSQTHKHLPEIMKVCGLAEEPLFSPIVADYYAGMEVTIGFHTHFLQLPCGLPGDITLDDFHTIYEKHYKDSALIHVSPLSTEETNKLFLAANENAGKDSLTIHITGNDDRVQVVSLFDNLGKGASGAAVECMNLMLGLAPETGLVI